MIKSARTSHCRSKSTRRGNSSQLTWVIPGKATFHDFFKLFFQVFSHRLRKNDKNRSMTLSASVMSNPSTRPRSADELRPATNDCCCWTRALSSAFFCFFLFFFLPLFFSFSPPFSLGPYCRQLSSTIDGWWREGKLNAIWAVITVCISEHEQQRQPLKPKKKNVKKKLTPVGLNADKLPDDSWTLSIEFKCLRRALRTGRYHRTTMKPPVPTASSPE